MGSRKHITRGLLASAMLCAALSTSVAWTAPRLTWQDNSDNEEGFIVERTTEDPECGSGWTVIGQVGINIVVFEDLIAIDKACYRVKAWNQAGESGYSNVAQYLAPLPPLPPPPCRERGKSGKCK